MIKKRLICVIAIVSLIYIAYATINVKAHNPADVNLDYNSNTEVLTVTILHGVSDRNSHYINSVSITVNKSMVLKNHNDMAFFCAEDLRSQSQRFSYLSEELKICREKAKHE